MNCKFFRYDENYFHRVICFDFENNEIINGFVCKEPIEVNSWVNLKSNLLSWKYEYLHKPLLFSELEMPENKIVDILIDLL